MAKAASTPKKTKKSAARRIASKIVPSTKKKKKSALAPKNRLKKSEAPTLEPEILPAENKISPQAGPASEAEIIDVQRSSSIPASAPPDNTDLKVEERALTKAAISPTDPLRQYMREAQRYPLLTPEEELQLAKQMIEKGDMTAARRLITANLRLVVKIAFEYKSLYTNTMDLIQEGNIGLMKAVSKFDPEKGARLGYYASWWIRSYILKYLLDNFRLVRIGKTQAQKKLFYQLVREQQRIEAQGMVAAPKLLAERLDVKEKDVREMSHRLSSSGGEVSIDAPMRSDESRGSHFSDLLADEHEGVDETVAREQLLEILRENLSTFQGTLNEKEQRVLIERILSEAPSTLQGVADEYGLSRERVRQIESKVIQKLKEFLAPILTGKLEEAD